MSEVVEFLNDLGLETETLPDGRVMGWDEDETLIVSVGGQYHDDLVLSRPRTYEYPPGETMLEWETREYIDIETIVETVDALDRLTVMTTQ